MKKKVLILLVVAVLALAPAAAAQYKGASCLLLLLQPLPSTRALLRKELGVLALILERILVLPSSTVMEILISLEMLDLIF